MKLVGVLGILIAWLLMPVSVSAAAPLQKFIVKAEVAAYHTVIVDDNNKIMQIISNTKSTAQLRVYRNRINAEAALEISDSILMQYWQLVPGGKTAQIGIAYKFYDFPGIRTTHSQPLLATEMLAVL